MKLKSFDQQMAVVAFILERQLVLVRETGRGRKTGIGKMPIEADH